VSERLTLLLAVLRAALRDRSALLAENLLLRYQLAVPTRPHADRGGFLRFEVAGGSMGMRGTDSPTWRLNASNKDEQDTS
jgi:hypothetical protein